MKICITFILTCVYCLFLSIMNNNFYVLKVEQPVFLYYIALAALTFISIFILKKIGFKFKTILFCICIIYTIGYIFGLSSLASKQGGFSYFNDGFSVCMLLIIFLVELTLVGLTFAFSVIVNKIWGKFCVYKKENP